MRGKSGKPKPAFPRTIGERAQVRIDQGEPWLLVWSQQTAIPLATIARKTGIAMPRLIAIESGRVDATADEIEVIAAELCTDAAMIRKSSGA